mmetsp:Transcript_3648/g.9689  ORF Transcript_3648/g.9689 Transcript_3648/m.9689 type:complete len:217 (+) Transcript_3648:404-1054(+)
MRCTAARATPGIERCGAPGRCSPVTLRLRARAGSRPTGVWLRQRSSKMETFSRTQPLGGNSSSSAGGSAGGPPAEGVRVSHGLGCGLVCGGVGCWSEGLGRGRPRTGEESSADGAGAVLVGPGEAPCRRPGVTSEPCQRVPSSFARAASVPPAPAEAASRSRLSCSISPRASCNCCSNARTRRCSAWAACCSAWMDLRAVSMSRRLSSAFSLSFSS